MSAVARFGQSSETAQDELSLAGLQAHVQATRDAQGNAFSGRAKLWNLSASSDGLRGSGARSDRGGALGASGRTALQLTHFNAEIPDASGRRPGRAVNDRRGRPWHVRPTKEQAGKESRALGHLATAARGARLEAAQDCCHDRAWSCTRRCAPMRSARSAESSRLRPRPGWSRQAICAFLGKSALAAEFAALDLARHSGELQRTLGIHRGHARRHHAKR